MKLLGGVVLLVVGCSAPASKTSTTPPGGGGDSTASASGGDAWHSQIEAEAAGFSEHKDVTASCGHDIAVKFDWATYQQADFAPKAAVHPSPASCAVDILKGLWLGCDDKASKPAASKVQSLTCHFKPCKDVRTTVAVDSGSTPTDEGLAEWKYALSPDGTQIDVYGCASSSVFTETDA